MSDQIGGFIGVCGGALFGLLGWFYGITKAKKQRALDETHDHIWQKSRSFSWYVTLISIYILFTLHLFDFSLTISSALGILMIIHLGSWAFSGVIFSYLLYNEADIKVSDFLIGIFVIIVAAIIFTVFAILTKNWYLFLMIIPFSFVGYLFINQSKKVNG